MSAGWVSGCRQHRPDAQSGLEASPQACHQGSHLNTSPGMCIHSAIRAGCREHQTY